MISIILALIFFAQCILIFTLMEIKDQTSYNGFYLESMLEVLRYDEVTDELISTLDLDTEFDERIRRMSDEIRFGADEIMAHIPTESEVLEDGLYNIPHNEINLYQMDTEEISQ